MGVSRTAAYHYFPNKAALLARLGERGFAALGARIRAAVDPTAPLDVQLVAGLRAYVDCAVERPWALPCDVRQCAHARPWCGPASAEAPPLAFSSPAAVAAFALLLEPLEAAFAVGALGPRVAPIVVVNSCWALAHGVAELAIGDNLKPASLLEAVLREGVQALLRGFQATGAQVAPS